jgi:hypothetical protein
MEKMAGFMKMFRKKKKAKDASEAREKNPNHDSEGKNASDDERSKRLAAAIAKKKESKGKESDFYKKYGLK